MSAIGGLDTSTQLLVHIPCSICVSLICVCVYSNTCVCFSGSLFLSVLCMHQCGWMGWDRKTRHEFCSNLGNIFDGLLKWHNLTLDKTCPELNYFSSYGNICEFEFWGWILYWILVLILSLGPCHSFPHHVCTYFSLGWPQWCDRSWSPWSSSRTDPP